MLDAEIEGRDDFDDDFDELSNVRDDTCSDDDKEMETANKRIVNDVHVLKEPHAKRSRTGCATELV
jgi:hypothetical protein